MKTLISNIIFNLLLFSAFSQSDYPFEENDYPFINYKQNVIIVNKDSSALNELMYKIVQLIKTGEGNINIVHIGDSHIQADMFSGRLRERLQTFLRGGAAEKGFVFPYSAAGTNNPFDYEVCFTGEWHTERSILFKEPSKSLGLSGINISTKDSIAVMSIKLFKKDFIDYAFNRVRVLSKDLKQALHLKIDYPETDSIVYNYNEDYIDIYLKNYSDSIKFRFIKETSEQQIFTIRGMILRNNAPGITYHPIGINGAKIDSYLKCKKLENDLRHLSPDLIIISLGANDTYINKFDNEVFKTNLSALINRIKLVNDSTGILLMTPADSYLFKKKINPHTITARDEIFRVAEEKSCSIWDFHEIMGGYGSIDLWYDNEICSDDKLHLNKKGYILQGDLFFRAFVKYYDEYIRILSDDKEEKIKNK